MPAIRRLLLAVAVLMLTACALVPGAVDALSPPQVPQEVRQEVASILAADSVFVGVTGNVDEEDVIVLAETTCTKQCVIDRLTAEGWEVSRPDGDRFEKDGVEAGVWDAGDFLTSIFIADWLKSHHAKPEQGLVFLSVAE